MLVRIPISVIPAASMLTPSPPSYEGLSALESAGRAAWLCTVPGPSTDPLLRDATTNLSLRQPHSSGDVSTAERPQTACFEEILGSYNTADAGTRRHSMPSR